MNKAIPAAAAALISALALAFAAGGGEYGGDAFARGFVAQPYTALIDAGHGGFDSGARREGVDEAPLNLSVARKVKTAFEELGVSVGMTRAGPGALAQTKQEDMRVRSDAAAQEKYDIVISIHQNAFTNRRACGTAVYYKPECEKSREAARMIRDELAAALPDVNHRETAPGNFLILKSAKAPAVMLECGFMSNPQELARLMDAQYQEKLAGAVARAAARWLETQKKRVLPESYQPERAGTDD